MKSHYIEHEEFELQSFSTATVTLSDSAGFATTDTKRTGYVLTSLFQLGELAYNFNQQILTIFSFSICSNPVLFIPVKRRLLIIQVENIQPIPRWESRKHALKTFKIL